MSAGIFRPSPHITLLAPIGRGGMAEVFLAALQAPRGVTKLAVLKRIWPELACDPEFAAMFLDEAKLAVRLGHPNVVQTYEVVARDDELALSMEYLEGQTLTRVLGRAQSQLTLAQRLRIVGDVLAGLEHAHNLCDYDGTPLGVVHRDVSTQNVFVTYDGHVKVMDFGVAKNASGSHHTRPGGLKGKLTYMAPEQRWGEDVDRRADLYSVGVILWELLAGRRLWQGHAKSDIARALLERLDPPRLPNEASLPEGLPAICRRALAPRAADRFSSAAEMERELARVLPAAEESQARALGRIMQSAFTHERHERRALIEAHLRGLGVGPRAIEASTTEASTLPDDGRISASFPSVTPSHAGQVTAPGSVLPRTLGPAWGLRRPPWRALAAGGLAALVIASALFVASQPSEPAMAGAHSAHKTKGHAEASVIKARVVEAPPTSALVGVIDIEPLVPASVELALAKGVERPTTWDEPDPAAEEARPRRKRKRRTGASVDLMGSLRGGLVARARSLAKPLDTSDPYAP